MRYQSFTGGHWVIRLEPGEEAMTTIRRFCIENNVRGASFMAFGAFERCKLSFWRPTESRWDHHTIDKQSEVVSLLGNIGWYNDRPVIHAHCSVGDDSQRTFSGHLVEATVKPTLEIFLQDLGAELPREEDEATGLKVLRLPRERAA